jgi:hypothetical protein
MVGYGRIKNINDFKKHRINNANHMINKTRDLATMNHEGMGINDSEPGKTVCKWKFCIAMFGYRRVSSGNLT